ncbi:MAG: endonuclease/exonuclease/phosphatase family protein, partial [Pseudomonadota bacterium]
MVSLNAWGGQCWGALEGWICDINADILCLQEVIRSPDGAPDWLTYIDPNRRLQQRPNLFDDVSKRLRDHAAWFSPSAQGPLSDDGGRAYMTQHGLGVWVRKSLPVTGLHTGFAYGRFRPCGWGSEPVPRALQFVRVWEPQSGCEIVIGHFHGIRHPAGKGDLPERQEQTETVSAQLQIFRDPTLPCILAGDFNILPDNMFFAEME